MKARVAIRRLRLNCLAPRDHPAPDDLRSRLAEGVARHAADALDAALTQAPVDGVLRLRRLEVDVTIDVAADPEALAALLARAILAALRRAEPGQDVVSFASPAAALAALVEALAERRADGCWWLPEAAGVKLLSAAAAVRTVLTADTQLGLEALGGLPPLRLAAVLSALGPREGERLLRAFVAEAKPGASPEACAAALLKARPEIPPPPAHAALFAYIRVAALRPALAGATLAEVADWWVEVATAAADPASPVDVASPMERVSPVARAGPDAADGPAAHQRSRAAKPEQSSAAASPAWTLSRFGGLLLLMPDLDLAALEDVAGADAHAVAHAALGLCAGRARFGEWLAEPLWRELFGLDVRASRTQAAGRLAAIAPEVWAAVAATAEPLAGVRDARFLLAPRALAGSRPAQRTLAVVGRRTSARFARRLPGFGHSSAAFLWANLLGAGAAIERGSDGWNARLSRPPLDVLISLSGLADRTVSGPAGIAVKLGRIAP